MEDRKYRCSEIADILAEEIYSKSFSQLNIDEQAIISALAMDNLIDEESAETDFVYDQLREEGFFQDDDD